MGPYELGLPIEMPFPYAIQGWLWALFGGLISSLLSSFVALPGLIALDEERQARHRLELLFCCAPKAAAQLELQSQSQNRSSQGYEFFSKKVGNILLGRVSGKAILGLGLALFGATGWFYNTSRLEMDFFSVPWPMLEQKLAPLRLVGDWWVPLSHVVIVPRVNFTILDVTGSTTCFSLLDQTIVQ